MIALNVVLVFYRYGSGIDRYVLDSECTSRNVCPCGDISVYGCQDVSAWFGYLESEASYR